MLQGGMSRLRSRCRGIRASDLIALFMVLQHASTGGKCGLYTLFHEDDMLRHIMQADKVRCDIEVVQRVLSISGFNTGLFYLGTVLPSYIFHGSKYRTKVPYQAIHLKKELVEDNNK